MPQLSNDEFVEQLSLLFKEAKTQGSIYLGQKRLAQDGPDSVLHAQTAPYSLVFRASNGRSKRARSSNGQTTMKSSNRRNFTTVVTASDLPEFWRRYSETLKKGTVGLRKKEKKKAKKN